MRTCPRCDGPAERLAFPLWLRPLRVLLPGLKRLRCRGCGWSGIRR